MSSYGEPQFPLTQVTIVAEGLDHPECVTVGPDGSLYAGGEAGQVYRFSLAGGELSVIGTTGGFNLGVAVDGSGNIYTCDMVHRAVMKVTPEGEVSRYSSGTSERPMICPNFAVFAQDGTLFVSDSGDWQKGNGCIWAIEPGGRARVLTDEVRFHSNGLALTSDGETLFCAESLRAGIAAVRLKGGVATSVHTPLPLPRALVADGLALDAEGGLIIGCYSPDSIFRFTPGHRLELLMHDPHRFMLASPTNIAFAGEDLSTLVIASLARWHVSALQANFVGQPLNYPEI